VPFTLDNIGILEGQQNYCPDDHVFSGHGNSQPVVEGVKPAINAPSSETEAYETLRHSLLVLIQVISSPILKVARFKSPGQVWEYLKETYYRDDPFAFIHQIDAHLLILRLREIVRISVDALVSASVLS